MSRCKKYNSGVSISEWVVNRTNFNGFEKESTNNDFLSNISLTCSNDNRVRYVYSKSYNCEKILSKFKSDNKLGHLITGSKNSNHHWNLLVPDFDKEQIKEIVTDVLKNGVFQQSGSYDDTLFQTTLAKCKNGTTKEVLIKLYFNKETEELSISNGWVIP